MFRGKKPHQPAGKFPRNNLRKMPGNRDAKFQPDCEKPDTRSVPELHGGYWLYGRHAVAAALSNPDRLIQRLLQVNGTGADLAQVTGNNRTLPPWENVERTLLDRLVGRDSVHQGLAARVAALPEFDLYDLLDRAAGRLLITVH